MPFGSLHDEALGRTKFKRAGRSIFELRKLNEFAIKNQQIPPDTEISPVEAGGVPAEWVRTPSGENGRVILFLHGGAFVMGSPATHRELVALLSASAQTDSLALDYRLAPEHPFPAAMQDAVSAYSWLLENGYSEKQIVIGGDSAGGGLALQTLLAMRDDRIPLPAAALFLSPVTDWVRFDSESYSTRITADPLNTPELCRFTASLYVGENDPETPLLYPTKMDLSGLPPLCVHVGDSEILLSDSVRFAERALACRVEVEFKIWPGLWHAFQASARFVPEARRSIDEIGRFIKARFSWEQRAENAEKE